MPGADDHDIAERGRELLKQSRGRNAIPRVISLLVLVSVLLLTGMLFFRVMALFVVPLFLAGVLVVVFEPVFKWFQRKLEGRTTLAALATTSVILLAVLVPCGLLGWRAYVEVSRMLMEDPAGAEEQSNPVAQDPGHGSIPLWHTDFDNLEEGSRLESFAGLYEQVTSRELNNDERDRLKSQIISAARSEVESEGPHSVLVGLLAIGRFCLGLVVMTIAVYFFFADGPAMVKALMHLSPLDDEYEEELLERFAQVSRAVVVATVLAAVVQGLLAGIGYWFALDANWPIFLLTMLTMVMAMVPFLGATAVWGAVALTLFIQGDTVPAIALAVYGASIVSTIDNVIKPLVLHGQSNLHPLLALLSVLGGITVLGPIGILVGPMLVAFLQALLSMLRKELDRFEEEVVEPALADVASDEVPSGEDETDGPSDTNDTHAQQGSKQC